MNSEPGIGIDELKKRIARKVHQPDTAKSGGCVDCVHMTRQTIIWSKRSANCRRSTRDVLYRK